MTRILIPLHGFVGWNGGLDLMRLIRSALTHPQLERPMELAFTMPRPPLPRALALDALRLWREWRSGGRHQQGGRAARLRRTAHEIADGHEIIPSNDRASGIRKAARCFDADLVFPSMYPLGNDAPPRIGYIFDFQHRHLPQLFPQRIRDNRDRHFKALASDSQALVVNSRAAAADVTRFLGVAAEDILAMPFTPYAQASWFETDPAQAQASHGIDGPYLLVCNHFWMHKDHATAIKAFARVLESPAHAELQMVMTGDPVDHRHPSHFQDLTRLSDSLGIGKHVHFLGLIPKHEQLALLRGCRALIQPTRFEGGPGGGSVYEAIGLGVPAIVSDIPINREIDIGDVHFFRTGDPDDLSRQILQALGRPRERPGMTELLLQSELRMLRLGREMTDFFARILGERDHP